ncbi:preprotein translocase subunit SecE [Candidatus Peribacteria bacterium]|nr:preprotein translocase subunit SecE [Candidatus Peribacteria bacterium]
MNAFLQYIQGSLEELRLVRWPTQQQATKLTIIVIIFLAVTSAFFGIVDAILTELISLTLR